MTHTAFLLALLLLLEAPLPGLAGLQMFPLATSGRTLLAPNQCFSKGLEGTCNGCVCCCYTGGAGIVTYQPTDTCTCARVVKTSQIWATVVLSAILVVAGLLVQLYFGGSLPISPYPRRDDQNQHHQHSSRRQHTGRIRPLASPQVQLPPATAPQEQPPAMLAII